MTAPPNTAAGWSALIPVDSIRIAVREDRARAIVEDFGRAAHAIFQRATEELARLLAAETNPAKCTAILQLGLRAALGDVEQLMREALERLTAPEH